MASVPARLRTLSDSCSRHTASGVYREIVTAVFGGRHFYFAISVSKAEPETPGAELLSKTPFQLLDCPTASHAREVTTWTATQLKLWSNSGQFSAEIHGASLVPLPSNRHPGLQVRRGAGNPALRRRGGSSNRRSVGCAQQRRRVGLHGSPAGASP